ncbi:hypothetical protein K1719_037771 [Acacia pycnantha]|nr:hypothetical protein K1719_037771 [Acacia pycnantha]
MKEKVDSPVGVLEDYFGSTESETSCSNSKDPTVGSGSEDDKSKPASGWPGFLQLLQTRSKKHIAPLHSLTALKFSKRFSRGTKETILPNHHIDADSTLHRSSCKIFTQRDIQMATNHFSQKNLIGKGGYAEVYKGCLRNGSLTSLLYGSKEKLPWCARHKIALGTAKGILYLHEGCHRRIIHRDIKAANILLSKDFEPQICDFGLAKWLPENWTHHTVSKFEGTFGYLAPEYLLHGIVDEKTDVYAFGVLLLELVTGRRALDYSQQSLVLWARPLLKKNEIRELVDPSLGQDYDSGQIHLVLLVVSVCIQQSAIRRPSMRQVVQLLNGNLSCCKHMKKTRVSFVRKVLEEEFLHSE